VLKTVERAEDLRQALLALLPTAGTLAGISVGLVGIVDLKVSNTRVETLADEVFLFGALGVVLVCYLIFFTLRHLTSPRIRFWNSAIDAVFLASLTLLLLGGFITVYAFL
jgi:nitrate reductase gamma subunit